jgi:hypothetical protein
MERSNAIQYNKCKLTETSFKTGNFCLIGNLNGIRKDKWKGQMQPVPLMQTDRDTL